MGFVMSYFSERKLQDIYDVLTKKRNYEYRVIPMHKCTSEELTKHGSSRWKVVGTNDYYVIMEREI